MRCAGLKGAPTGTDNRGVTPVPATPATPPSTAADASPADRLRGRLMAQSLGQLLDRAPGAREVLPHLAALERGLLERGAGAIALVPPHWLQRICSQLSSLPIPEQDPPLHDLMQRLLKAVGLQRDGADWESESDAERTVVIREISHSQFLAAEAEQATTRAMSDL